MENVPVHTNSHAAGSRAGGNGHDGSLPRLRDSRKKAKLFGIIGGVVALLLALGIGGWFLYQSSPRAAIDTSKYQAVFFTNGQVYFGKLQVMNSGYFKLTDIFYLQAQSTAANSQNPQASTNSQSPDVQLIKLGGEIHAPTDEMVINKDQVLFFENLKKDGKVSQSITTYQSKQK